MSWIVLSDEKDVAAFEALRPEVYVRGQVEVGTAGVAPGDGFGRGCGCRKRLFTLHSTRGYIPDARMLECSPASGACKRDATKNKSARLVRRGLGDKTKIYFERYTITELQYIT